jgi:tRNA nucleotidyltransferase/poly(A) polymerase
MKLYLVGGAVRDIFMGVKPKDFDFVFTDTSEEELLTLGYTSISKNFPVYSHPSHPEAQFCLARTETKVGAGYNGFSVNTENVSLYEDLLRRDFTMNAMAMEVEISKLTAIMRKLRSNDRYNGQIIDYFRGQEDIKNKVIKHVGSHFTEDPLRMLRVARFQAKTNFTVDKETKELVLSMLEKGMFDEINQNRVYLEFQKSIPEAYGYEFLLALDDLGLIPYIFKGFDIDKLRSNFKNLKFVRNRDYFFKLLFFGQSIDLKVKSFLIYGGIDTVLEINENFRLHNNFLNYSSLSPEEKVNTLYKSRYKNDEKKLATFFRVLKKNYPKFNESEIIKDYWRIKDADLSQVDKTSNVAENVLKMLVEAISK